VVRVDEAPQFAVDVAGDIFGRGVVRGECGQLVEQGVVQLLQHPVGRRTQLGEVHADPGRVQLPAPHRDLHFPVVAVQALALAPVLAQLVRG